MKTLDEYIRIYEAKTKERVEIIPPFFFYYSPSRGFCEYGLIGEYLYINQCCGDMLYWSDIAHKVCRLAGLASFSWLTRRSPKAFMRRLGFGNIQQTATGLFAVNKTDESIRSEQFGSGHIITWEVKDNG